VTAAPDHDQVSPGVADNVDGDRAELHTQRAVRRFAGWVLALSAGTLMTGCGMLGPSPVTYTIYGLTCCAKADVEQVWQPGKEVDLHWIVESSTTTTVNPNHNVVITATLMGPYSDIPTLKRAIGATRTVQGTVIEMDDRVPPPDPAVSIFLLPADLPPGYYNLAFNTDFGGGNSAGGASIVRVGTE
jgi:hypothetical protein